MPPGSTHEDGGHRGDIAIIGMGCRFPGHANSPSQFWSNLIQGIDAISEIPSERFDVNGYYAADGFEPGTLRTRWAGLVDSVDGFDARFFGISPREAARMDPQQRLLVEMVWDALQDGGETPGQLAGTRTGVFIGNSGHDYGDVQISPANQRLIDLHTLSGTATSVNANRISFLFDFRGPSIAVDTACSSALTAVHLACQSLRAGECDIAAAGGVNVLLMPEPFLAMNMAAMLSPEGRCKTFDARANGFVRGEGAGIVILKPLAQAIRDGNPIYAVVRATAVNQDGRTASISQPNPAAQEALLREVLTEAGVAPGEVQYVEAHGTGTAAGDPVEANAIGRVLREGRDRPCWIGSVKSNIGHLEAAAGIAGLIKAALVLKHRQIPPNLHFEQPNPAIPFDDLRLRVPVALTSLPSPGGLVGVNSFGFGGTNAHVLLEPAPPPAPPESASTAGRDSHLLTLSARDRRGLNESAGQFAAFLEHLAPADLPALCYTAAARRTHHEMRLAAVGDSPQALARELLAFSREDSRPNCVTGESSRSRQPRIAFVFSGMGSQQPGIGRRLLRDEPVFRGIVEECDDILRPISGWSLIAAFEGAEASLRMEDAFVAQVANFTLQAGLLGLWSSWGVEPGAVVGHSTGEIAAAYASGALPLRDALVLAFHRGRILHRLSGRGRMLAAGLSCEEAQRLVAGRESRIAIGAHNAPRSVTFSGDAEVLAGIAEQLEASGLFYRDVSVAVPYHSPLVETLKEELAPWLGEIRPRVPRIPVASPTLGTWAGANYADPAYWWRNIREQVQFARAVDLLIEDGYEIFLEVGAHPVLRPALVQCLEARQKSAAVVPSLRRGEDDCTAMLRALGQLHCLGRPVNWTAAMGSHRVLEGLPGYPWNRERHWLGPEFQTGAPSGAGASRSAHPLLAIRLRSARPCWEVDLRAKNLDYLHGHVVQGGPVYPAAAYLEMMRAGAEQLRPGEAVSLREVSFEKMLPVPAGNEPLIQLTAEDGTFTVFSATDREGGTWTAHATGRTGSTRTAQTRPARLAEIRSRCGVEAPVTEWYHGFQERGLDYSGPFRSVRELWQGDGEALGRIEIEEQFKPSTSAYGVHPALLDSALQITAAALASRRGTPADATLLPASLSRFEFHRPAGAGFWSHVSVRETGSDSAECDIHALDGQGNPIFDLIGLRFALLGGTAEAAERSDCLYRYEWELATQQELIPGLRVDPVPRPTGATAREVERPLNALTGELIRAVMARLHCDPRTVEGDDLARTAEALGIHPTQRNLFGWLLRAWRETEDAHSGSFRRGDFLAAHPESRDAVELISHCGAAWHDVLTGVRQPQEVLFAPEVLDHLAGLYRHNAAFEPLQQAMGSITAGLAARRSGGTKLKVLEIGAGTGGATAAILPQLPPHSADYCFTDVSPFFLTRAKAEFAMYQDVSYHVFDVHTGTVEGSLPHAQFDVILAADVFHTAPDLGSSLRMVRELLAPGGLLIFLEVVRPPLWADAIFGMFPGWWRQSDSAWPVHSALTREKWRHVLREAAFDEAASLAGPEAEDEDESLQAVFVARASGPARREPGDAVGLRWMILPDQRGVAERIAASLEELGHTCNLLPQGGSWTPEDLRSADRIVHLWSMNSTMDDALASEGLMQAQQTGSRSVLHLVQELAGLEASPQLWVVTAGAQVLAGEQAGSGLAHATVWGLGRVVANEHPELRCRLVDLSDEPRGEEIDNLVCEMLTDAPEEELAFRASDRFRRRLRRTGAAPALKALSPGRATFHLGIGTPGTLGTLRLTETPALKPGPGQLLLRVRASGLNFRDVMVSSGLIPSLVPAAQTGPFGCECAGIVVGVGEGVERFQPGDEVLSATTPTLASHVVADACTTLPMPPGLSFEDAAGILLVFMTAHYALNHVARIQAGERVLIHAAAGGVGLAAIQMCQQAGAEIFATAGSETKRAYLQSLGVSHVYDSRSLDFADQILEETDGEGVDVVLNSLAGEAIAKGLSVLREHGRFLEIGKRDLYANSRIGLLPFLKGLAFHVITFDFLYKDQHEVLGALAREVMTGFQAGRLHVLPTTCFPLSQAEQAFRYMAQAKHIGKIVITVDDAEYRVVPSQQRTTFRKDGTYLISGGLGGFALATANWMAGLGAGHIVLMSRSGSPIPENQSQFDALLASGAQVRVVKADVSSSGDLDRVLRDIRATLPPLRGVFHAAMVLEDKPLTGMTTEDLDAVLLPKIAGAWNLHRLTRMDPLDIFMLYSSVGGLLGNPMQGNYGAANAFLDELALYRRARGLPALSVNWGVIGDTGYVARNFDADRHLDHAGHRRMPVAEALRILDLLLRQDASRGIAARMDPAALLRGYSAASSKRLSTVLLAATGGSTQRPGTSEAPLARLQQVEAGARRSFLERHIRDSCAKVLGAEPLQLNLEAQLTELGLDSLMAVEVQTILKIDWGVSIPAAQMLQGISVREVTDRVLEHVEKTQPAANQTPSVSPSADVKLPLAPEQRRFWFLAQLDPQSPALNMSMSLRFSGALNIEALEGALNTLVARHEALRATFALVDAEPVQRIASALRLKLSLTDLSGCPLPEREAELQKSIAEKAGREFDLRQGPLLRVELFRLDDADHCLLLTIHHIVVDEWSVSRMWREFGTLYPGLALGLAPVLPDLPQSYSEYVRRAQHLLPEQTERAQLAYWKQRLAGVPVLELPFDRPRQLSGRRRGTRRHFEFPDELWEAVTRLSRREGATPFMTLLAVYQVLLHRYSGQDTVCVGSPVSRRERMEVKGLVGCFVNTLALRTDCGGNPGFLELLARVRETVVGAQAHQEVPFESVVKAVQPVRDPSFTPLFQTLFVLHSIPLAPVRLPALTFHPAEVSSGASLFDLILVIGTSPQLKAYFEYDAELFEAATIERMISHFLHLLRSLCADPTRRIDLVPLTGLPEHRSCGSGAGEEAGTEAMLHELFEQQVLRTPHETAVVCGPQSLSYDQLNRAANRIGRMLQKEGAKPGETVALHFERSPEAIAGILGVLKTGAAYLPLDPSYPEARLGAMLSDARPALLLTSRHAALLVPAFEGRIVRLEDATQEREDNLEVPVTPRDLAYVIYTSGSSGQPKGVLIEHRSVCNQVLWRQQTFPLGPRDAVIHHTSLAFDPSVWECLGPLSAGARVIVARPDEAQSSSALCELIRNHGVTVLQGVPSRLWALAQAAEPPQWNTLRYVFSGGETLARELQDLIRSKTGAALVNVYGTTETAIEAAFHICSRDGALQRSAPIGRPISNVRIYVLDKNLQPVPPGVPGELCVAGRSLARGYLNSPELTQEKFVEAPFLDPGQVLYRTGDLGRLRPGGLLEFLGRDDRQIKVRGIRVEPGEVEAALNDYPRLSGAAVKLGRDLQQGRLQAWVVPRNGLPVHAAEVRRFLRGKLPQYMVPSEIFFLDALPLTAAGKIDYSGLASETAPTESPSVLADPLLNAMAELWGRVLPERPRDGDDNFFDLGGDSLLAVELVSMLSHEFAGNVRLAELLHHPTVAGLAEVLRARAE